MRRKISKIFLSAATILLVAAPLLAHHGAATFDTEREVRLKATVTEWIWSNPHCFLKFDAKDETGDVRNWAVETSNPADMTIRGWHRTSFKAGDQVTVSVYPVKNGAPVGRVLRVVLANGDTLVASGPAPQRLAQPNRSNLPNRPSRPDRRRSDRMMSRVCLSFLVIMLLHASPTGAQNLPWNNPGRAADQQQPGGPAPRRDLSGIWDAGSAGVGARGYPTSPLTPWGEEANKTHKPGDGPRMVPVADINDPLSTLGDPAGFPRILLFELRPFQVVHTPNSVLMLYMFEKRWRVIWTDGRPLPKDPDPRWYGYSLGHWEDDYTFVVETVGMDERTWLDNAGDPHSDQLRVEERYHRSNQNTLELTVTIDDPKAYTKPWVARDKLPLRLLPSNTDLMEMIPSASEAATYRKAVAEPSR